MPTNPLDTQLRARIDAFADELADLVRQAALESVREALGDGAGPGRRRGPGRPRGSGVKRKKAGRRPGRPAGRRSAPASPAAVLAQVRKGDGVGVGEIAAALGTTSDAVKPAVAELLADKRIRKTGQKRGTKYHAGRGGAGTVWKKATKKKATRKAGKNRARRKRAATRRTTKRPVAAVA